MAEKKGSESSANIPKVEPELVIGRTPPLYNFISVVVISVCITGLTWLARSGALQMWARHPRSGENYEYGWFFSLAFGVVGGFFIGSLIMWYFLDWYWRRCGKEQRDEDA